MNTKLTRIVTSVAEYFNLAPELVSQPEAEQSIREGVSFKGTNMLILILAIFIASLGLNTNSTAVIIGAMLISPLMGPIIGLGLGVGIQDFELLKRSGRNLLMATIFSIATSTVYFLISPVGQGHSELLARTSPTIYDVLIAFFGGGAGIVALGSRSKGNVIPGVAIATALMPPLCTVGYGLATWQVHYFAGALYLFIINSIFICLATFIGIKLMHYKPVPQTNPVRARKIRRIIYIVAFITLLPSLFLTYDMIRQSRFSLNAERFVQEQCVFPQTHVLSSSVSWNSKSPVINLTLIGKPLPQDSLTLALSSRLQAYGLKGATLNIVQGMFASADSKEIEQTGLQDIYHISQQALLSNQRTIDSLQYALSKSNSLRSMAVSVMPEMKVIFPQVKDLAISRPVMASADTTLADTLNIALVTLSRPLSQAQRSELSRYLSARLSLPTIRIVDLPANP